MLGALHPDSPKKTLQANINCSTFFAVPLVKAHVLPESDTTDYFNSDNFLPTNKSVARKATPLKIKNFYHVAL